MDESYPSTSGQILSEIDQSLPCGCNRYCLAQSCTLKQQDCPNSDTLCDPLRGEPSPVDRFDNQDSSCTKHRSSSRPVSKRRTAPVNFGQKDSSKSPSQVINDLGNSVNWANYRRPKILNYATERLELMMIALIGLCYLAGARAQDSTEYFRNQPREDPYYVIAGESGPWLDCSVASQYTTSEYGLQWLKIVNHSPRIIAIGNSLQPGMNDLYDLDTSSGSGSYNLRIKTVSFENDNGDFYCQVTGASIQAEDSRPAHVVVLVKPGPPQITRHPDTPIREGARAEAVCESTGGNPAPDFEWFFSNGSKADSQFVTVEQAKTPTSPTVGRLVWRVSAKENNLRVTCRITNRAMTEQDASLEAESRRMQVLYPPKVTVGPVSVYNVEKGTRAQLDCSAEGNPTPTNFRWMQNGLGARSWDQANISFVVDKDFTGNYSCQVTNSEGTGKKSLELNVFYEPQIYVQEILTVSEGKRLELNCNVDANPPAVSVRWDGPGGVSSGNKTLTIHPAQKKDRGNYTCTAKNVLNLYGEGATPREAMARTEVKVSYAPGKGVISVESEEPIVVGDSVTLTCTADDLGFPEAQYQWKAPGEREYQFNSQSSYTITNVQLTNAGSYFCMPHNQVRDGEEGQFTLEVNEPARLDQFLPVQQEMTEKEPGPSLPCSARGHPKPEITWYKDGRPLVDEDTGRVVEGDHWSIETVNDYHTCDIPERCSFKVSSRLNWKDQIRWNDKGMYTCSASNGIGEPHLGNMSMIVRHAPQIINTESQKLAAADLNENAQIVCRVSARPEPGFRWYHNSEEIASGTNYAISTVRNETYDVYASVLTVQRVGEPDMGEYMCKAYSNSGEDSEVFKLQKKTKPHQPSNLRRISATHTSIEMGWDPGFNGGYPQMFELAMRMLDPVTDEFAEEETPFQVEDRFYDSAAHSWTGTIRRKKRFVAAENPPVTKNVTGLSPLSKYMFRVIARNSLGDTDWLPWTLAETRDPPESSSITKPTDVHYHGSNGELTFKSTPDLNTMCLMIFFKREIDNEWRFWDCVKPIGEAEGIPKNLKTVRVRYCLKESMVCSNSTEALNAATVAGVPWKIVVPILAVILVLIALAVLFCVCCVRKKTVYDQKKPAKGRIAGQPSKDYEQETNQARPKTISAPYLGGTAEKTPLSSDPNGHQAHQTAIGGSQADSGVFTLGSQYQYDQGYNGAMGNGNGTANGAGYANGGLHASYDEGNERWGNAADPYGDMDPFGNGYAAQQPGDFPDMNCGYPEMMNGGYPPEMNGGYPYYDSYGNPAGMVDMNPQGTLGPSDSQDESLNSGYSTPNNRRIMREIIV